MFNPILVLGSCISLSYLLPFRFNPYASFYNDALVIFAIAIAYLLLSRERKIVSIQIPWITAVPCCLVIVLVAQQAILDLPIEIVILPICYLLIAGATLILGATIGAEDGGRKKICLSLAWAFVIAGLISILLIVIQLAGAESLFSPFVLPVKHNPNMVIRPFANLGQPNHLALLFCIAIASVWYLYQTFKINTIFSTIIVLCFICGLVLTQSRIGWIVIPLFCFSSFFANKVADLRKIPIWVVVGFFLTYIFLILGLPTITSSLLSLPSQSIAGRVGDASHSERIALFQQAFQMSIEHPWFGVGWYQFGSEQVRIAADFQSAPYSRYAHNLFLNFAAELGWPITLALCGALFYWCYLNFFRRAHTKEIKFALLFLIPIVVHSMVEFPLWYAYVLIPTALIMGAITSQDKSDSIVRTISTSYIVVLFALVSIGLVTISYDYRRVVAGYQTLSLELLGLRFERSATTRPTKTMFPQFYDYFEFAKTEAVEGISPKKMNELEKISRQFGYAPVLMDMSFHYALNNQPDEAIREMETLQKLHKCQYKKYYSFWKMKADQSPEKYLAIFRKIPQPEPTNCLIQ